MKFVEKYKQYQVKPETIGFRELEGDNYKYVFSNGYGASIIRHKGSYGYEDGLFELAVLVKVTEDDYDLCYTTPITNNVIGWLSDEKVCEKLEAIKNLEEI